jgi:hypothetical protein
MFKYIYIITSQKIKFKRGKIGGQIVKGLTVSKKCKTKSLKSSDKAYTITILEIVDNPYSGGIECGCHVLV